MATPQQIVDVARRITRLKSKGHDLVVVVSAMGDTTDDLCSLAMRVAQIPNRRELDMLLSTGERISIALLSMALIEQGCPAISFTGSQAGILTDDSHNNARIVDLKPARVTDELNKGSVVVLAGFQGVNPRTKEITTLGRGGSDLTAIATAAHLGAKHCEILKDVDGVYSADPRIVKKAVRLEQLSYDQLIEFTFWGSKVLHYRSVELAQKLGVEIYIGLAHGEHGPNGQPVGGTVIRNSLGPKRKEATMLEQQRVLSVNSHSEVRRILISQKEIGPALSGFAKILRTHQLAWPQILDSEKREDGWSFLITGPSESLGALEKLALESQEFSMSQERLSTVTATCYGSVESKLPQTLSEYFFEERIPIHKILTGPMSLTVVTDSSFKDSATLSMHKICVEKDA